jgi:uncharacterized membrane protein
MNQKRRNDFTTASPRDKMRRAAPIIAGTSLAVLGLSRRSKSGLALAVAGGALAYFGSRQEPSQDDSVARGSVLLNCSPKEAYALYRNFEELPLFMNHLESVTKIDEGRYRWTALGPLGTSVSWDAEIVQDRDGELISWRSLPGAHEVGSNLVMEGEVRFQPAPGNRGTLLNAETRIGAGSGKLIRSAAKVWSSFSMQQDLRRFKALLETGEIPTTEGQTHGPRSRLTGALRVANPDQPMKRNTEMREAFNARRRTA